MLGPCVALVMLLTAQACRAQTPPPPSNASPSPASETQPKLVYPVSKVVLTYGPRDKLPHPDLPPINALLKVRVKLSREGDIYIAPAAARPAFEIALEELQEPKRFSAAAIVAINQALAAELNRRGFYGVWAAPDSNDIEPRTGRDLRDGREELRLVISAVEVQQVRTLAKGRRFPADQATNHPAYRRIVKNSPLQPPVGDGRGSLLDKERLDEYVGRLNRFPGRSAAAAISAADQRDGILIEYLISEDRPWTAYAQVANTGTGASGDWRERFGFIHQQLTGRDDMLAVDYVTADFQHSHAFFGSYEIPLLYPDRLKTKVYGSYGEFTADEVGLNLIELEGSSWTAGGEFTLSPFHFAGGHLGRLSFAPFFFDFALGAKWQGVEMHNGTFNSDAATDFFLPYAGVSLSSFSRETRLTAGIQFEGNVPGVAGTDSDELPNLGRMDTDDEWVLGQWGAGFSFFLDPLLARHAEKLVHEFWFSARGQFVFGDRRLVPQQAELIGGAYSVRGYPESFDLGDNVVVGSGEYRFYLARALRPAIEERRTVGAKDSARAEFGNPYRFRSNDGYKRTDWDVILRAFVDGGQTQNNQRQALETDRSLLSTGVGMEFQLRRNLNLRLDYGIPLLSQDTISGPSVDAGDGRVHFMATVAW